MIKKLNKKFFAAILTFAMTIGMIAPVNVAADDEYMNFDQDLIYAIVSTTTGKALNIKTASWTSHAEADGEYNAKANKINNSSKFMFVNENDGSVTIKYAGIDDGQNYYLRTESGQTYVWADTRSENTTAKYKIIKTADNQGIIESMKRVNEYLSIDSNGKLVYTTDKTLAEKFNFVKNPGIISNIAWIENVATGKLVTFVDQPDENFSAIKVTGDVNNISDTEKFKVSFHTNDNGIENVISFESVSKPGYQIASDKWVDGAVPTIGSYKKVGGGWEAIAAEAIGDGLFVLKDAATGKLVTVNNEEFLEGGYEGELTDREKFIIHNSIDIAEVKDLKADDSSRTQTTIDLSWTNPISLYTDVYLYQKASNEVVYTKVADVTGKDNYQVSELKSGMQYSFKLRYINGNGDLSATGNPETESNELVVRTRAGEKPATPANVKFTEDGNKFRISWDFTENATHYQVLRAESMFGQYAVIETVSKDINSILVTPQGNKYENYYRIIALNNGQAGDEDLSNAELSEQSEYVSLETSMFGRNVIIFADTDDTAKIDETVQNIFKQQNDFASDAQFRGGHYSIYYKPGDYRNTQCVPVGFYTHIGGLGKTPYDVQLNNIEVPAYLDGRPENGGNYYDDGQAWRNATCNFWRSAENLSVTGTGEATTVPAAAPKSDNWAKNGFNWSVAQAAPLRRVYSTREVRYDWSFGWASGGYTADCLFEGNAGTASGQQYFTRNSEIKGSATGTTLNNFNIGVKSASLPNETTGQALTGGNGYSNWGVAKENGDQQVMTSITTTPEIKEKPFLFIDDDGEYKIFQPAIRKDSSGISWSENNMGEGKVLSLKDFYIAQEGDSAKKINEQLENGKNIFFTPGIYHAEEVIKVNNKNTVILGTGMATIIPDNEETAMQVADVDGITVAGLIFDAGSHSKSLLVVGEEGKHKDHSANPTLLTDIFFRIGGTTSELTKADNALIINSDDVIGDHFWIWRADHGAGVKWYGNESKHGLIVNGDDVTCYALFNEHFQSYHTLWNGDNGATYFYQNETAYDPISQEAWMSHNGTVNGYSSYKVANNVNKHYAVGLGIYNVFINTGEDYDSSKVQIQLDNAIEVPNKKDVIIENACLQTFANDNSSFQIINSIVNGVGNSVSSGIDLETGKKGDGWSRQFLLTYNNGTAVYGKMPAADQKGKFVGTVTEENIKALGDDDINTQTLSDLYNANKDKVENNYTTDSWIDFARACDNAVKQLDTDLKYAYQKDFDKILMELTQAIDNLVLKGADYSKVDSAKKEAEKVMASDNYTKGLYTDASKEAFDKANKALNDLAADLTVLDQEKVDNAIKALYEAIDGLTLKAVATEQPVEPNKPDQSVNNSSSAKTGDDQMIYGYGIITLLALGSLMVLKRRHTI